MWCFRKKRVGRILRQKCCSFQKNTQGVNAVIATILMVVLVVAIAATVYIFVEATVDEPVQKVVALFDVEYSVSSGELVVNHLSGDTLLDVVSFSNAGIDGWWNPLWSMRIPLNISSSLDESDVQIKVNVSFVDGFSTDFSDLRFVDSKGSLCSFWIEEIMEAEYAVCWLNIPSLVAGTNTFFAYGDNPSAESISNPHSTFPVFVNFSSDGVDSYGGSSQDKNPSNIEVVNDNVLRMWGNNWKSVGHSVNVVGDGSQCIEFWFKSSGAKGEINGIGLDSDASISSNLFYQVFGSQSWGIGQYRLYAGDGSWQFFSLVLDDFSGSMNRFVFCNDADAGQSTNVLYKDVRLRTRPLGSVNGVVLYDDLQQNVGSGSGNLVLENLDVRVNGKFAKIDEILLDGGKDLYGGSSMTIVFNESAMPVSGDILTVSYLPTNQMLLKMKIV